MTRCAPGCPGHRGDRLPPGGRTPVSTTCAANAVRGRGRPSRRGSGDACPPTGMPCRGDRPPSIVAGVASTPGEYQRPRCVHDPDGRIRDDRFLHDSRGGGTSVVTPSGRRRRPRPHPGATQPHDQLDPSRAPSGRPPACTATSAGRGVARGIGMSWTPRASARPRGPHRQGRGWRPDPARTHLGPGRRRPRRRLVGRGGTTGPARPAPSRSSDQRGDSRDVTLHAVGCSVSRGTPEHQTARADQARAVHVEHLEARVSPRAR